LVTYFKRAIKIECRNVRKNQRSTPIASITIGLDIGQKRKSKKKREEEEKEEAKEEEKEETEEGRRKRKEEEGEGREEEEEEQLRMCALVIQWYRHGLPLE